jgi:hypothetical protein
MYYLLLLQGKDCWLFLKASRPCDLISSRVHVLEIPVCDV